MWEYNTGRRRDRKKEYDKKRKDVTANARRMLSTSPKLRYVVIANSIKVFKFNC
jgi:hypothetical protein